MTTRDKKKIAELEARLEELESKDSLPQPFEVDSHRMVMTKDGPKKVKEVITVTPTFAGKGTVAMRQEKRDA